MQRKIIHRLPSGRGASVDQPGVRRADGHTVADVLGRQARGGRLHRGLEVFDETGALRNSVHAGSGAFLNVGPGKTVTVGTAATVVFHEDQTLTLNSAGNGTAALNNGSGRVVGTSKNVLCTALLADKVHAIADPATCSTCPPPPFTTVPLIKVP